MGSVPSSWLPEISAAGKGIKECNRSTRGDGEIANEIAPICFSSGIEKKVDGTAPVLLLFTKKIDFSDESAISREVVSRWC